MISYKNALEILENLNLNLESQVVHTENSLNCICAQTIQSNVMLPPFQSSNMDGFALNSKATANANELYPVTLKVLSTIAAGDPIQTNTNASQSETYFCYEVMTGAPVPSCCDCVIPIEDVQLQYDIYNKVSKISFGREVQKQENIRLKGEDFPLAENVIQIGEKITPEKIMLLSALGISKVNVFQACHVAILSTGKEIVDNLEQPLKVGQIYNSNTPYLKAALQEFPTIIHTFQTIPDDEVLFHKTMDEIEKLSPHIILTTGAVSAGKWDFIPNALKKRQAEIYFHKVAIKPGKPILVAKLKSEIPIFCLPGNPVSTMVGFHFFLSPFLRKSFSMQKKNAQKITLKSSGKKKKGMTFFLKGKSYSNENSQLCAEVLQGQESFKMKPLLEANGFVILDEETEEYTTEQQAFFLPLEGIYE